MEGSILLDSNAAELMSPCDALLKTLITLSTSMRLEEDETAVSSKKYEERKTKIRDEIDGNVCREVCNDK
jgi:hypothetical protein